MRCAERSLGSGRTYPMVLERGPLCEAWTTHVKQRRSTHRSPARFIARTLDGAVQSPFPAFIEPCNPTLRKVPPSGSAWVRRAAHLHEARQRVGGALANNRRRAQGPACQKRGLSTMPSIFCISTASTCVVHLSRGANAYSPSCCQGSG